MKSLFLSVVLLLVAVNLSAQTKTVAERLGYPADAKLLIIHADDLAVAHSEDAASFDALDKGAVTSASMLVPCPWLTEVAAYAKAHPDADLGLHIALTSEWNTYRWGPVESKDKVPSLLARTGRYGRRLRKSRPMQNRMKPSARCGPKSSARWRWVFIRRTSTTTWGSSSVILNFSSRYVKVAHDYHLPFLAPRFPGSEKVLSEKDIVMDAVVIADPSVPVDHWKDFYLDAIKDLKPGLTEMIVHLGHDDAELQAVTVGQVPYGSAWRQRDYDVMISAEFKKALQDNHVILVKWKDLQKLVQ